MINNPPASVPLTDAAAAAATAPRLQGRVLVLARVGWVVMTLLVLTLNAIAIPRADALLQAACQQDAWCIIRGVAPADLRPLQQVGLSPGFLAAYQIGWYVGTTLIFTALAALIFWRRSADGMALLVAYLLVLLTGVTFPGVLDLGLRTVAPAWYWLVGGLQLLGLVTGATFFLLFPTGRFVPGWTRWGVLVTGLYGGWYVFFSKARVLQGGQEAALNGLVIGVLLLGVVVLQVNRYRRLSTFRERQQTKWVVFGFAVTQGSLALLLILVTLSLTPEVRNLPAGAVALIPSTVTAGLVLVIPISITIAILRTQLWDIDVLIRGTLIYGSLTAILAAVYSGVVLAAQLLGERLTGVTQPPAWVIVLTTLLVAALLVPLNRRLQALIDRRFYRAKYDAARTLQAFAATLRTETDLQALSKQLMAIVQETMQPASVSLWLRESGKTPRDERTVGSEGRRVR